MKNLNLMMLLFSLSGCTLTSSSDSFAKDKDACEQASRGSSPYANSTDGTANDQWSTCMKDHGWRSVQQGIIEPLAK
jgi:hypothetical protein